MTTVVEATTVVAAFQRLQAYLQQQVIGQPGLIERLLVALLADGHLLVEGAPGLAKTRAIKALAAAVEGEFQRIQFTPDLLPADLTGTDIFRPDTGRFEFQQGPLFHPLILADEINRAPAKVQAALLEAMAERHITVGGTTYALPALFLVMATQNPLEQAGTYPLPEAQLDRFLLYVRMDYPDAQAELEILQLALHEAQGRVTASAGTLLTQHAIHQARQAVLQVHMTPALEKYTVQLVMASRQPQAYGADLQRWLAYGASSRGIIALARVAKARAWLHGRDYVTPDDLHALAHDVLRHRIGLSLQADAEEVSRDHVVTELLCRVAVP